MIPSAANATGDISGRGCWLPRRVLPCRRRLTGCAGYMDFPITAGEWTTQLERVDAASLAELLVPMPTVARVRGCGTPPAAGPHAAARQPDRCRAGEARTALEPVLEAARGGELVKGAQAKPARAFGMYTRRLGFAQ